MLVVDEKLSVPLKEFVLTFSRSSGPGGQNVNKVNSKVTLHWRVEKNKSLPESVKQRFTDKYRNRINNDGDLVITSQRFRDQGRNVADCLSKLRELIAQVAKPPKVRKKRKVSVRAKQKRVEQKRRNSDKKQSRKPPRLTD